MKTINYIGILISVALVCYILSAAVAGIVLGAAGVK